MKYIAFLIFGMLTFASCNSEDEIITPESEFFRIYNEAFFDSDYFAVDIKQTDDGGYLVLASSYADAANYVWLNPIVLKLNAKGTIEWQSKTESQYVNPAGNLLVHNGSFGFFCMNGNTLGSYFISIDLATGKLSETAYFPELLYPLSAKNTHDNGFILLSYNRLDRRSVLTKISTALSVSWSNSYPLIEDGEEMLIKHITKRGTIFPFFVDFALSGNTVSYYYLNGFYRYSFSTVFASATDGSLMGVNNGFRYEGAISSAIQLSGNSFALTYFFRGKNFYLYNHTFNTSATTSIENLGGIQLNDLVTDATVKVTRMKINGTDLLIFASNSNLNRIVLNVFDAATGSLINKYEINQAAQTELGAIAPTADNGLVITGKTMVFGKFPRIFVLKIPSSKIVGKLD